MTDITRTGAPGERESRIGSALAALERDDLVTACALLDDWEDVDDARAMMARASLLEALGQQEEAQACRARAAQLDPQCALVAVAQARQAIHDGNVDAALEAYERAWTAQAGGHAWQHGWIMLLVGAGRLERALEVAQRFASGSQAGAKEYFALGYVLHLAGRLDEALAAYLRCAARDSRYPMLYCNVGGLLAQAQRFAPAREFLEEALRQDPLNALAWTNLAVVYLRTGGIDEARVAARRAVTLDPRLARAHQTHSYVLRERQDWEGARSAIDIAHGLAPQDGSILWSLAMLELLAGDYENGWMHHEARWWSDELAGRHPFIGVPRWDGAPLEGKTLLVWSEQGYGDVMQFVRFLPVLAQRVSQEGAKLVFSTFAPLLALLRRSLAGVVDEVTVQDHALPPCDVHVPLASLPLIVGARAQQLPAPIPYLMPDRIAAGQWASRMPRDARLRVGIAWSGSETHQRNAFRSIAPKMLGVALGVQPHVRFYSLQRGGEAGVQLLRQAGLEVEDFSGEFQSFDVTAAVLANLDLVITVCTSVAHLAGGMGVRTWLLLDGNPHWVWMTHRTDTPWYPGVKLYRQPQAGRWEPVLAQVAGDLRALAQTHSRGRPQDQTGTEEAPPVERT